MTGEARRLPRRQVAGSVPVADVMGGQVVGHLGNLSEGGLLLLATQPLCEDALYQLEFALDGTTIGVGAHLLWSAPANTPGQAWCGFRFLTISEVHRARVRAWVESGA
ncbi:PilZ domain-containing protein [Pseudoxanthomonas suwonensis]|jgi:PilZ domain.|uniref:PilZ domain-containing protein n=1 Tax=Pseudoxanthomonas suwonensis TaxID=314722 RepID=UPI00138F8405|nr:PilZ domain-containing protein [Pseudoxanthomonas suwonensis]KAF1705634.1 pilus assembly protein PilZ [Pseudoxanthomonas suwonensis]